MVLKIKNIKSIYIVLMTLSFLCLKNAFCEESLLFDLDGDNFKEEIKLTATFAEDDETVLNGMLIVKSKGEEFRRDIGIFEIGEPYVEIISVDKSNGPYFISISSFAGAHGMNLYLYSFSGQEIKEELSVFSDAPSIEVKDVDKDDANEIIAKSRDYDSDPIKDSYIKVYKYLNKKWQIISVNYF